MQNKKLAFGMMRLPQLDDNPEHVDLEKTCEMVDAFLQKGYTYFDTSYVYHNGKSEEFTRKALVERHPRESFTLATKLPTWAIKSEEDAKRIFAEQLQNCGVDYFDYYLVHNLNSGFYDNIVTPYHIFEILSEYKKEGKIKHLGFSVHDAPEFLERILNEHPEVEFVQIAFNYYDYSAAWVQSKKCYDIIRRHSKLVNIMEPVKGGMLTYPPKALFEQMQAKRPGMTPAAWALRFAADQEGVQAILSGMSTVEQVLENTAVMEDPEPLTDEEKQMLIDSASLYREMGPFHIKDFSVYDGLVDNGLPLAALLESYNAWLIQKEHGAPICAEFSYYAGPYFRSGVKGSWVEGTITDKDGNDITETVKEAEAYFKTFIDWVN